MSRIALHSFSRSAVLPEPTGPPSRDQAKLCTENDWNRNLFTTLRAASEGGLIDVTLMAKNVMGGEYP
ncbi:MAG: hypothetical protein VW338_08325, partial [Rhodospirillaceae bacterium]